MVERRVMNKGCTKQGSYLVQCIKEARLVNTVNTLELIHTCPAMSLFLFLQKMWQKVIWEFLKMLLFGLLEKLTLLWRQVTYSQPGVNRLSRSDYGTFNVSAGYGLISAKIQWGQTVDTHSSNNRCGGKILDN